MGKKSIVWRLGRLGRSLKDLIETVQALEQCSIELRSLKENIDTTTPTGKLMFHMTAALAEFERDVIRERTWLDWTPHVSVDTQEADAKPARCCALSNWNAQNNCTLPGRTALLKLWPLLASRAALRSINMSSMAQTLRGPQVEV
ncbi:MAG TPA: recombinase family protein [Ktedonobacteraceae bacterium]|nr:recombinase family protein [Ktedonobacteraceae bacterium]